MNIFAIEGNIATQEVDWVASARSLDNYRVVKMATETCQILSTVLRMHGLNAPDQVFNPNHPCVLWAGASRKNFYNLIKHCNALVDEYYIRFPNGDHSAGKKIKIIERKFGLIDFHLENETTLPQCVSTKYKSDNLILSYRKFYASKPNFRYPINKIPKWFSEYRDLKTIIILGGI